MVVLQTSPRSLSERSAATASSSVSPATKRAAPRRMPYFRTVLETVLLPVALRMTFRKIGVGETRSRVDSVRSSVDGPGDAIPLFLFHA